MLFLAHHLFKRFAIFPIFALLLISNTDAVKGQFLDGSSLVKPKLVVGNQDLTKPFTVGVHFTIEPGWHIYWINPGDAGLTIDINWQLPDGYQVQELLHPVPVKFVESGVVGFGYSREVMLLATVVPPKTVTENTPKITANINWLVCKETCLPGEGITSLNVSSLNANELTQGQKEIEKWQAKLPQTINTSDIRLQHAEIKQDKSNAEIQLIFQGSNLAEIKDFFPYAINDAVINYNSITIEQGKINIPLQLNSDTSRVRDIQGVLKVADGGVIISSQLSKVQEAFSTPDPETDAGLQVSLIAILGFAFVGGLLLNIMPCVLPVLSLKVLGFVEHAQKDKAHTRNLSVAFLLGVLVSFWALAGVVGLLQQAGEQIGWGFQFQSPAFVVAMSVIVFVFGLNLVGVFEFSTPSLTGQVGSSLSRNDWLGSFMNGVLATTLATPCTAPFLGTALGFAFSQPFFIILLVFSVVGLGLASPYVLLSWHPEWLKFIPKPGPWMNRFKQGMGFLLFATLIWLLSVLGSQLGSQAIVVTLTLLLGIGFALWMVGSFLDFNASKAKRISVWMVSGVIILFSYIVTFELWFPIRERNATAKTLENQTHSTIKWNAFDSAFLEETVSSGSPVFIDFTADWCFTCKVTEQTVLETTLIREKIEKYGITPIKADWTSRNDEITQLLKRFGRSGVPLYVVIPGGKMNEPIVLPEVITQTMLIEAFQKARAQTLSLNNP